MAIKHFLGFADLSSAELRVLIDSARTMKEARIKARLAKGARDPDPVMRGYIIALVFEQPSTRTRTSFHVGIRQLGGSALTLNKNELQLGRGETIADTARVLSRYVDMIMVRTDSHSKLEEMAQFASVPVINGLTDKGHPCQILADLMTLHERFSSLEGKTVAWVGDCNNMCLSWIEAAEKLPFCLRIAAPKTYQPPTALIAAAQARGAKVEVFDDPKSAVAGVDCVTTDTWASMNHTDREVRLAAFRGYQVNEALMKLAAKNAVFLHCLPAHRGEEVTDSVIDGAQSLVWDEAENRMHGQKAVMRWCLGL
ncbi:MAG TPA: ornithine carbamoyltransferase [Alphaproteobacteria bacterium]|nr:ornithine carbamoyltransferase [Alphaproteobacteria bacterium]